MLGGGEIHMMSSGHEETKTLIQMNKLATDFHKVLEEIHCKCELPTEKCY